MKNNPLFQSEYQPPSLEWIGDQIPGGLFVYRADENEELVYSNCSVYKIFGCKDLEEFKELTGYTFRGMVHPMDYERISLSIKDQIRSSDVKLEYIEYRICRKDGSIRWVDDYGHFVHSETYGDVNYVFFSDITEKKEHIEQEKSVRDAVIESLTHLYNTVWLINDVETEHCSLYFGDTGKNSVHATAIKNALSHERYTDTKIEYVNTMVAEVDRERMQEEISLPYMIERLKEKGINTRCLL